MPDPKKNIVWEPIRREKANNLGEKLRGILHNLPVNTPDSFRKGAERAASLLVDLEEGRPVVDQEFLAGIQRSFILPAKVLSQILPNPIAMPPWIDRLPKGISAIDTEQQNQASIITETIGEKLVRKMNGRKYSPKSGAAIGQTYFVLKEAEIVPGKAFKVYIEGISQLNESAILELIDDSIARNIAPDEMKHHEGNTVLYWKNCTKGNVDQFVALSKAKGIETRGPASDVFIIKGVRESVLEYTVISNDQVGTTVTSGFEWRDEQYSPEQFFKQWIQFCFAFGRRPDAAGYSAFLIAQTPADTHDDYETQVRSAYTGDLSILFLKKGNRSVTKVDCFG